MAIIHLSGQERLALIPGLDEYSMNMREALQKQAERQQGNRNQEIDPESAAII